MLLRIESPHFVAGAIYGKVDGQWKCLEAAPILRWLLTYPVEKTAVYFKKKGWKYEWIT